MKKAFFTLIFFSLLAATATAQVQPPVPAPQSAKYRVKVIDQSGGFFSTAPLVNSSVSLKVILTQFVGGTNITVYSETFNAVTDGDGWVDLNVGAGAALIGKFDKIRSEQGAINIQIYSMPVGSNDYSPLGPEILFSVPHFDWASKSDLFIKMMTPQIESLIAAKLAGTGGTPAGNPGGNNNNPTGGTPTGNPTSMTKDELENEIKKSRAALVKLIDQAVFDDKLLQVKMSNNTMIYAHKTDNGLGAMGWGSVDVHDLQEFQTKETAILDFNGEANTFAIATQLKSGPAKVCADLVAYGFDDWYLPTAGELNEMGKKLGPKSSNPQMKEGDVYWSSSEKSSSTAWAFSFGIKPTLIEANKYNPYKCRCIRKSSPYNRPATRQKNLAPQKSNLNLDNEIMDNRKYLMSWIKISVENELLMEVFIDGTMIYVSPVDVEEVWGGNTNVTNLEEFQSKETAILDFNGEANMNSIVISLKNDKGAAKVCDESMYLGFDDWYLPAAGELNKMYEALGPQSSVVTGKMVEGTYWSSSGGVYNQLYTNAPIYDKAWSSSFSSQGVFFTLSPKIEKKRCRCIRKSNL